MPGPPPPPPPMLNLPAAAGGNGDQGRNMLLQSIRAGKPLKKTVTVDKSKPAIPGQIRDNSTSLSTSSNHNHAVSTSNSKSNGNGGIMALGELFAGGMPKLKPIGLRGNITERDNSANISQNSQTNSNAKRGPPPIPPPASQKPQIFQSMSDSALTSHEPSKTLPKPNLVSKPTLPSSVTPQKPSPPSFTAPQKPSPPPKKLNITNLYPSSGGVARAQSMRVPRSPPVLAPVMSSLHQSQDCLNDPPPPPRPTPRHLRPPVTRPPPPPPSRITAAPNMPPPPPPPPHRSAANSTQRHAPPPPPPPTPPTRGSSMSRNGQSSTWLDLETRFADAFNSILTFPPPEPFNGFPKVYSSRNAAKQQAPAPPPTTPNTMLQLNAAHGGRQWSHDAASSAC